MTIGVSQEYKDTGMIAEALISSKFELSAPPYNTAMPNASLDSLAPTTPIILEINGIQLRLPLSKTLVIGRISDLPGDVRPDVSLNNFGAVEHGISRQHVRITRKRDVVYLADLNSSTGTCLNGRPLTRNCYRVLNSGDELQLGLLKLTIKF
jgi:pSer/pThr/pTyr-binding forkhead associated (FHA) protein